MEKRPRGGVSQRTTRQQVGRRIVIWRRPTTPADSPIVNSRDPAVNRPTDTPKPDEPSVSEKRRGRTSATDSADSSSRKTLDSRARHPDPLSDSRRRWSAVFIAVAGLSLGSHRVVAAVGWLRASAPPGQSGPVEERRWVWDPSATVFVDNGPDGQPGIAGVDDGNNGRVDDPSERGATGSDDRFLVIAGGSPSADRRPHPGEPVVATSGRVGVTVLARGGYVPIAVDNRPTDLIADGVGVAPTEASTVRIHRTDGRREWMRDDSSDAPRR